MALDGAVLRVHAGSWTDRRLGALRAKGGVAIDTVHLDRCCIDAHRGRHACRRHWRSRPVDCRDHGWHRIGRHRPNSCPPEPEFVGRSLQKASARPRPPGSAGMVLLLCLCPARSPPRPAVRNGSGTPASPPASPLPAVLTARLARARPNRQPEFVILTVRCLAGGSDRHERGPGAGVATTTSATGGLDQPRVR